MEVAGFVVGVVPVVIKAIDLCGRLVGAGQSIRNLLEELVTLRQSLQELEQFLKSDSLRANNVTFNDSSVLVACSTACKIKLENLNKQLEPLNKDRLKRVAWVAREREHREMAQQLRNFGLWLHFALSLEGCKLLAHTADAVSESLSLQLHQFQTLQTAIEGQTEAMKTESDKMRRIELLNWISTFNYEDAYHSSRSSRAPATGEWFLDKIRSWLDGSSACNLVWCQGKVGSGKTVLTSLVIDNILCITQQSSSSMAYFFFKHQDHKTQTLHSVLSCILRQFVQALPQPSRSIDDLYQRYSAASKVLSIGDCEGMLFETLRILPPSFIVFDALDECTIQNHLLPIVDRLRGQLSTRVLLTSRDPCPLKNALNLSIEAQEGDITAYIRWELARSNVENSIHPSFATDLETVISGQARGMFLLPVVHLRTVLDEPTIGDMEDTLASLPASLSEALAATISRIRALPQKRAQLGLSALMWISSSRRPLDLSELTEVLAIKDGQVKINDKYHPTPGVILECTRGLAVLDRDSGRIVLAHYSIQEYLDANRVQIFRDTEPEMAKICMQYLLCEDFDDGPYSDYNSIKNKVESYPFLSYAAKYWGVHAKHSENNPDVWVLIHRYIENTSRIACGDQIRSFLRNYRDEYLSIKENMSVTPLHAASEFGLDRLVEVILQSAGSDVNTPTIELGSTPIIHAASANQVETLRILLQYGANPYRANCYGNALDCAAEAGASDAIRVLVAYGMDPNEIGHNRVPLLCTLDNDKVDAFQTLWKMSIQAQDIESASTCLTLADKLDSTRIVKWLLGTNLVDINCRDEHGETALHKSIKSYNCIRTTQLLLAHGANPLIRDTAGRTPHDYARDYKIEAVLDMTSSMQIK